jgi:hypothetical protein
MSPSPPVMAHFWLEGVFVPGHSKTAAKNFTPARLQLVSMDPEIASRLRGLSLRTSRGRLLVRLGRLAKPFVAGQRSSGKLKR